LDAAEALAIAERAIRRAAGKPIIVGVSAPGFAAMRSLARSVMDLGAAGVMIAPSAAARTEDQIAAYFRNAVEAIGTDIPWVLQDYPHSTRVTMSNGPVPKGALETPSLATFQHEACPRMRTATTPRSGGNDSLIGQLVTLV